MSIARVTVLSNVHAWHDRLYLQIDFEELCCLAEDLIIWRRSP